MLYAFLKFIVQLATRVFYREVSVKNKDLIPKEKNKALLIVANHPNTFMDPILIGSILTQEVHFLTNGGVFKTKFLHWLLGQLNMIPIFRSKDKNGGNKQNQKTFEKCYEHLKSQKSILIFPEGTSVIERKIRPVKTGTARIGLGAEVFNDFKTKVEILPIGLNYEAQNYFRSKVHIRIGEMIPIKNYKELLEENEDKAVRVLTQDIQTSLEKLTVVTENEQEDEMIRNIETIYKHEWQSELSSEQKEKDYVLAKVLTNAVAYFKKEDSKQITVLQTKLNTYFNELEQHNIHDRNIHSSTVNFLFDSLFLIIFSPIYLYGLLNNYLAYRLPSFLTYKITKDETYFAPITLSFGILSFSILYTLQIWSFYTYISSEPLPLIIYVTSLPITGIFTFSFWKKIQLFKQEMTWRKVKKSKEIAQKLHLQRQEIIELLTMHKKTFFENKEKNKKTEKIIQV